MGLRQARPDWRLGFAFQGKTLTEWYGSGDELFERWWDLGDEPARLLASAIAEFRPDLIHSHNLPDALTVLAHDVTDGRVPVVHDVHDLQSLRKTPYEHGFPEPDEPLALEKLAIEESAAVVAVSDELLEAIAARYRLPPRTLVFSNYALLRDLPRLRGLARARNGDAPRLVYQGTLATNGGHYDLREIFAALVAAGAVLDLFPSREVAEYRELAARLPGLVYHDTVDPALLLRLLRRYDFGWAGFNASLNGAHVDTALPNKVFEYIGCGVPVLTLAHRALERFVREKGIGIALAAPADLRRELARHDLDALRSTAAAARAEMTIEANIGSVVELYERVAC